MRIGQGYDVHRLVEGRKLILGGVEIEYDKGLLGHSDADVLVHALRMPCSARRSWANIGKLFPDSDPAYEGADSLALLREVGKRLRAEGFEIGNLDSTVIAQAPKLAPHIQRMRANIAAALDVDVARVSVKATD